MAGHRAGTGNGTDPKATPALSVQVEKRYARGRAGGCPCAALGEVIRVGSCTVRVASAPSTQRLVGRPMSCCCQSQPCGPARWPLAPAQSPARGRNSTGRVGKGGSRNWRGWSSGADPWICRHRNGPAGRSLRRPPSWLQRGVCDCTLTTANAMQKSQVLIAGKKTGNEGHTAQDIAD